MKTLRLLFALVFAFPLLARAQFNQTITNPTIAGTSGNVAASATFTFTTGSTIQFGGATTNQLLYVTNSSGKLAPLTLGAGLSISGGSLLAGSSTSHNPTATIGLTAVNGSAGTYMTSDSAPALSQAIIPTWTGLHIFSVTAVATAGTDYGMELTPTLNQRNTTNFVLIFGNETVTQAGSGNQYFLQFQIGGTNKFILDSTGTIQAGAWNGTAIGPTAGGTGLTSFSSGALLTATSNNVWGQLAAGTIQYILVSNGNTLVPGWQPISNILDFIGITAQGVVLERGAAAWQYITPGVSGTVFMSNGTSSDPSYQAPLSQLLTTTGDVVYSSSGSTAQRLGIGTTGQVLTVVAGVPGWTTFAALTNPMTTLYDIIFGGISGTPTRLAVGANNTFLGVNGSGILGYYAVAGTSAANPTATVGTAAVNGVATTFMRSDGAPAINLTMTPTWTGQHTFSFSSGLGLIINHSAGNEAALEYLDATGLWTVGIGIINTGSYDMTNNSGGSQSILSIAYSTGAATWFSTVASTTTLTGGALFAGGIGVSGQVSCGNLLVANTTTLLATVQAALSVGGTTYTFGAPSTTGFTALGVPAQTYTITGSATTANFASVYFGIPTLTDASAGTITNGSTVWINGAMAQAGSAVVTNKWSLYVNAGNVFFGAAVQTAGLITKYNGIATAGWGVEAIPGYGRSAAAVAAVASVATYTPASDGDFRVSATVDVTASVTNSFTVTVTYKDDNNVSQTVTLNFTQNTGTLLQTITNITGTGDYEGVPIHLRAKGGNAITVATTGTFTSVTYNVSAVISEDD